ncbi:MAG: hypothetical protein D6677_05780 [Calditrichaeota bacterium]|nr:MAG: hypothetical protein D6677_05780 [Calditrichota bacterium]
MQQKEFEHYFGRRTGDYISGRFTAIFSGVGIVTLVMIIYLANYDYSRFHTEIQSRIIQKYQSLILNDTTLPVPEKDTTTANNLISSEKTEPQTIARKNLSALEKAMQSQNDAFINLPEPEEFEILSGNDIHPPVPRGHFGKRRPKQQQVAYDAVAIEALIRHPYDYKIKRNTAVVMDAPSTLFRNEIKRYGHRDQNEILQVMYEKQRVIENCFQKAARYNTVRSGAVKVEFEIDPRGFVIPGSVRIIHSTIRNRMVEQCIKKNISRWRNFAQLEDQQRPAHVVHKFIFN